MSKILNIYKPIGITPLEAIEAVKNELEEYKDVKIGYAGRLDPLAHGVLVLMTGESTKDRDKYLGLEKEYEFTALFGIQTDTYDVMGLIKRNTEVPQIVKNKVNTFVNNHIGKQLQPYPPYSSKALYGRPLFWWARNDQLSEIVIPQHEIEIMEFKLLEYSSITKETLRKKVTETISVVNGDFRQKEILKDWEELFSKTSVDNFRTAKFKITCSSGTYIRVIINELGEHLGCGAIALDILRSRVGSFAVEDSLHLKSYT